MGYLCTVKLDKEKCIKVKILLIDPPYDRLIGFKSEWFPLGIAYIASYLIERGYEVGIYHAEHGAETEYKSIVKYSESFNRYKLAVESDKHPIWEEASSVISSFKPDIVGISVLTPKVPSAIKIANICKKINPCTVVVVGGQHPTVEPKQMLLSKDVDFVVRGEGEETFYELVKGLQKTESNFHNIAGLSFRDNGAVVSNINRKLIKNLDLLPLPARDKLFDLKTYTPVQLSMVMTSRGCPYQCHFCASHNVWGNVVRFRSIKNVLEEIKELKSKYLIKNINFMDDSFTMDKKYLSEFCQVLIENNLDITWSCLTRINIISDEIIALMKRAGCAKVDIGIESGNQRVLDLINKGITLRQIRDAVKILRQNKMYWSGFFMFGFPTETEEEIMDTLNLLKELKPNWANISIFTPYPATKLFELSIEKGIITEQPDYTLYSHQNPYLRHTDKVPQDKFYRLAKKMLNEVHRYNSSYNSLIKRALTRKYHKNPRLMLEDMQKVISWLKK